MRFILVSSCPSEVLGGLNACFLCRKEGHLRKVCKPPSKSANPNVSPPINNPEHSENTSTPVNNLVPSKDILS